MILKDSAHEYTCTKFTDRTKSLVFVLSEKPEEDMTGTVQLLDEDGPELRSFESEDYPYQSTSSFGINWSLTFNQDPPPPPPDPPPPPPEPTIEEIRARKIQEISVQAHEAIIVGMNAETSYGDEHFSLDVYDQINLSNLAMIVANGAPCYPYHSDGNLCVNYSAGDLSIIVEAAFFHVTYHTTYHNLLKTWIAREEDKDILEGIFYGSDLPDDLIAYLLGLLSDMLGLNEPDVEKGGRI